LSHPVVARLEDPDPAVRRAACREAVDDPSAVLLLPALGVALGDRDPDVRRAASTALTRLSPQHAEVDELLRAALYGDQARRRVGAALTRAALAPPEPALLPAIAIALGDADPGTRWEAARVLVDLGRLHHEALPVAIGLARTDPSPIVRRMAVFCVGKLAPHDEYALALLREAQRDPDLEVREAASLALLGVPQAEGDQKIIASSE
jgi:HEAT repeat protein